MKRTTLLVSATSAATAIMLTMTTGTAGAVIHEQVAAYCSGGGHGAINDLGELASPLAPLVGLPSIPTGSLSLP